MYRVFLLENKLTLQELKTRNQLDQAKEKLNQADLQIQDAKEQVNLFSCCCICNFAF